MHGISTLCNEFVQGLFYLRWIKVLPFPSGSDIDFQKVGEEFLGLLCVGVVKSSEFVL